MTETDKDNSPLPTLEWLENGTPVSARFDDSYFSIEDGREETREVFITGNGLPARWRDTGRFTIAELGFGTGLNFFETAQQWTNSAPEGHELHYVSFERFPIDAEDILKTIERWRDLLPFAEKLCQNWPPCEGYSKAHFGSLSLHLYYGDARQFLNEWSGEADAWYLDGFNPAKNPELWEESLMCDVYNHTRPNGTFSTYTAAGWVRRNLQSAGFEVRKVPGFRHKKDRLEGRKVPPSTNPAG